MSPTVLRDLANIARKTGANKAVLRVLEQSVDTATPVGKAFTGMLTAAGEDYLPSISRAFHAISDAIENIAPALKGRPLRLAISPALQREELPAIGHMKGHRLLARLVFTNNLSQLLDGRLRNAIHYLADAARRCDEKSKAKYLAL
jgi:DNA-binding transcriptional LysR family regulator